MAKSNQLFVPLRVSSKTVNSINLVDKGQCSGNSRYVECVRMLPGMSFAVKIYLITLEICYLTSISGFRFQRFVEFTLYVHHRRAALIMVCW